MKKIVCTCMCHLINYWPIKGHGWSCWLVAQNGCCKVTLDALLCRSQWRISISIRSRGPLVRWMIQCCECNAWRPVRSVWKSAPGCIILMRTYTVSRALLRSVSYVLLSCTARLARCYVFRLSVASACRAAVSFSRFGQIQWSSYNQANSRAILQVK
jgi:hypothetical protein